jgi:hypothetical protein
MKEPPRSSNDAADQLNCGRCTYISGELLMDSNWVSSEVPPMMIAHLSGPWSSLLCFNPLAISLPTLKICKASSLVGHMMIALGPCVSRWTPPRRCNSGITYASVFPEPVRAMPKTSLGGVARDSGMVDRWMGVGALNPRRLSCLASGSETPALLV